MTTGKTSSIHFRATKYTPTALAITIISSFLQLNISFGLALDYHFSSSNTKPKIPIPETPANSFLFPIALAYRLVLWSCQKKKRGKRNASAAKSSKIS